jgi:hypothetical protein
MIHKIREWGLRYLPAEIFCLFVAVIASFFIFKTTSNPIATAYFGALSETIAYYSFISIKELKGKKTFISIIKSIRNLFLEFGFSEILDSFVIRPFFMYIMPMIVGNLSVGIILGKIISDVIFYIPTIIMYEFRKKHLKD